MTLRQRVLPGSFTDDVLKLTGKSNTSVEGIWDYAIRAGKPPGSTVDNPLLPVVSGKKFEFNQERYLLGDLQFKKGEIKKAELTWENIKSDDNVWRKLSQEKLKQAAWDVNYKNHIRRIPAMSQLEEQK